MENFKNHNDTVYCFEEMQDAELHKTALLRLFDFYFTKYPRRTTSKYLYSSDQDGHWITSREDLTIKTESLRDSSESMPTVRRYNDDNKL